MWIHYETNRLLSLCIWAQYIAHSTWLALCALFSAKGFLRAQGTVGQERRITWVWMWHCSHRVCILMYIYHILMYTIMKDKQWVCTFADHRVTEIFMGDKCSTTCCHHHSGWAVSNSYMLHIATHALTIAIADATVCAETIIGDEQQFCPVTNWPLVSWLDSPAAHNGDLVAMQLHLLS